MLISDALRHSALLRPGHAAAVDGDRLATYAHLVDRAARLANALRDGLGLARSDRFALLAPNRLEYVEALFAAGISGCALVPVSPRLSELEITDILVDSQARALLVDPDLAAATQAVEAIGFDGQIVSLGPEYERLLATASGRLADDPGRDETDAVLQPYTSGTTGRAKGVVLSHRNLLANTWTNRVERSVLPSDRYLASAPWRTSRPPRAC